MEKYTAQYGGVWGYYEGDKPTLVVGDVEAMQEILIKQFSKFHSRRVRVDTGVSGANPVAYQIPLDEHRGRRFAENGKHWTRFGQDPKVKDSKVTR